MYTLVQQPLAGVGFKLQIACQKNHSPHIIANCGHSLRIVAKFVPIHYLIVTNMLIQEIIQQLEQLAPTAWQESYDNAGLITGKSLGIVQASFAASMPPKK